MSNNGKTDRPDNAGRPDPARQMKPGIPMGLTSGIDAGQPTAQDLVDAEARKQAARTDGRPVDERLAQRHASVDEARGGRVYDNADWERAAARTDPEARERMRAIFRDSVLPNLPGKEGFHRCWVSTTHNNDTPQRRLRLGYWFYKLEDARGEQWHADEFAINDAASPYHGCIMWREMVAMEIRYEDYCMIMRELHHDQPMDQARSIYEGIDAAGQQIRDMGGRTTMAPGMESLRQFTRPPRQFEAILQIGAGALVLALQMLPFGPVFY